MKRYNVLKEDLPALIDDKKLIADFNHVINCGRVNGNFARKFIIHLLQTRYLFDRFIIKREYTGEDKEGEWSLKELCTSGQGSKKKPYYPNTSVNYAYEKEKMRDTRHKECLMIQSALRVSYTSPKIMHWITELLQWLFFNFDKDYSDNDYPSLPKEAEKIAAQATKKNFLDGKDYQLGLKTPHIVFNFLDYWLWKIHKKEYDNFVFEFRNSVEHWYPQHPSDGNPWENKDTFGNLCIISRSINSKFSNLPPKAKASYGKIAKEGSLKLRIMGEIMQKSSNEDWINDQCQKHEKEMIKKLNEAIEVILNESCED